MTACVETHKTTSEFMHHRVDVSSDSLIDRDCDPMLARVLRSRHINKQAVSTENFLVLSGRVSNHDRTPVIRKSKKSRSAYDNASAVYVLIYKGFSSASEKKMATSASLSDLLVQSQVLLDAAVEGASCTIRELATGELVQQHKKVST